MEAKTHDWNSRKLSKVLILSSIVHNCPYWITCCFHL